VIAVDKVIKEDKHFNSTLLCKGKLDHEDNMLTALKEQNMSACEGRC